MRQQATKQLWISLGLPALIERNKSNHERRLENELGDNDNRDIDSHSRCDIAWMDRLGDRG